MKLPKAPAGCYWRGQILWGRVTIRGHRFRWSLGTGNPGIAIRRRQTHIKALREPASVKDVKRRVMAGLALTEDERAFVASAIDLAMDNKSFEAGPAGAGA